VRLRGTRTETGSELEPEPEFFSRNRPEPDVEFHFMGKQKQNPNNSNFFLFEELEPELLNSVQGIYIVFCPHIHYSLVSGFIRQMKNSFRPKEFL
jgi:cyclophilin family peptidyl-prolyl cis-trans isomerase